MGGEGGKLDVWGGMWHVLPCGRNLGGICAGLFDKVRVFVREGMGGANGMERAEGSGQGGALHVWGGAVT